MPELLVEGGPRARDPEYGGDTGIASDPRPSKAAIWTGRAMSGLVVLFLLLE